MNNTHKKYGLLILKVIVFVIICWFIATKADFTKIIESIKHISLSSFIISFMLKLLGILASIGVLTTSISIFQTKVSSKTVQSAYFSSYFFSNIGLGSLGADAHKWFRINKEIDHSQTTTCILITEKIMGLSVLAALLVSAYLGIILFHERALLLLSPVIALGLIYCTQFVTQWIAKRKVRWQFQEKLKNYLDQFQVITSNKKLLIKAITYSLLFYVLTIVSFDFIVRAIEPTYTPLLFSWIIIPTVIFINTIPISFQGLGVREISMGYFFVLFGFSLETGLLAGFILLILNIMISILSGLYYFFTQSIGSFIRKRD